MSGSIDNILFSVTNSYLFAAPLCRKVMSRFACFNSGQNYNGLVEDDSEQENDRSTSVFDPRHQEIDS